MQVVFEAILAKWDADTDLSEDVHGGLHFIQAPQETEMPFCVFTPISQTPYDTFTEIGEQYLITFDFYTQEGSSYDPIADLELMNLHLTTCFDNCELTIDGYNHIYMQRQQTRRMPDPQKGFWHYSTDYRLYAEKTGSR